MRNLRMVYKKKSEFESDLGNGKFFEGFVIRVGYAYVYDTYQMPGNLNGFGHLTNDYPEHNRYKGFRIQQIDTSPEMVRQSLRAHVSGEFAEYTVRNGDTLWGISKDMGFTVDDLALWNNISNPDKIKIGQKLLIDIRKVRLRPVSFAMDGNILSPNPDSGIAKTSSAGVPDGVSKVGIVDKILAGTGTVGAALEQSNQFFYITTQNELVTFRGSGPPNATSVAKIGRNMSRGAFIGITLVDLGRLFKGRITPERFVLNASLNSFAYKNPYFGVPYALTEIFYPGGFIQAVGDRADLEAERRKAMGRWYLPLSPKSFY